MSRKWSVLVLVFLFAVVISTGGCGGGSSDYVPFQEPEENEEPIDNPVEEPSEDEQYKNITYPDGVTGEMLNSEFWTTRVTNPNEVIVSLMDIAEMNEEILKADTNIVNLETLKGISTSELQIFSRDLYIDGEKINEAEMLEYFKANIVDLPEMAYCVTVKRANLKCWPISGILGYSATDPDDEAQLSILEINSPFVVTEMCLYNGHAFYYGQSEFLTGWIDEEELAICHSKEEWLSSWKFGMEDKDFIVVTQDKIRLEPSLYEPEISELELMLGARLRLVYDEDMPSNIGEREKTWFNYVVYVPTRDEDGYYVRKEGMIPARYSVSIGYLSYTQTNIAQLALSMVGNRFGWGGMMKSLDASLFIRQIYACFGMRLPTNTSYQRNVPYFKEFSDDITSEDKQSQIKNFPIGTILYFPGFTMVYMGSVGDTGYFVGDLGVVADVVEGEDGEDTFVVKRPYTVTLGPLTMYRRNGQTFLESVQGYINFADFVR